MTAFSHIYNLGRLGQAGDTIRLETSPEERTALAAEAGARAVPEFSADITLRKLAPDRFALDYALASAVVQACVVSLEDVATRIDKRFTRELHQKPHRKRDAGEIEISPVDEDLPEEIDSLHYDLAAPLIEEFILALDPYPRAPGVEFVAPEGMDDKPESPFAALKGLKSPG